MQAAIKFETIKKHLHLLATYSRTIITTLKFVQIKKLLGACFETTFMLSYSHEKLPLYSMRVGF